MVGSTPSIGPSWMIDAAVISGSRVITTPVGATSSAMGAAAWAIRPSPSAASS